ncbi:MAG: hypothetical protein GEU83_06365 [Pseudonocardiaceae bacterium]|nr:hypothetical protein [Pseudonocardiaceae bacterium]
MTAVMPGRGPATAPEQNSRPPRRQTAPVLHTWCLSVRDWRVHALAEPAELPMGTVLSTRCRRHHPIGCPVSVARRGDVCPRCLAGGVERLELLPDRIATEQARPW